MGRKHLNIFLCVFLVLNQNIELICYVNGFILSTCPITIFLLSYRCVIRGCVPKKILVYGASFCGEFEVSHFIVLL